MQRIVTALGIALIIAGIFGKSYTWHYDHRETATLEDYATTEFLASRDVDGNLEGANLSLWDYRYDDAKLLKKAILFTDGAPWEVIAATRQTPGRWRNENKIFVALPKSSLKDIMVAKEVRFKFFYDNGQTIDLPLGQKELVAWQRKLRW